MRAEPRRGVALFCLLLALALSALPLWRPEPLALLALLPAQIAFALTVAGWRGQRRVFGFARGSRADLPRLLLLWALAAAGLAALVAWPLLDLLARPSLAASLSLSGALGLAWLILWRYWPLLAAVGVGQAGLQGWRDLSADSFAGWVAAGLLLALLSAGLTLAWPGLLPEPLRLPLLLGLPVLALLAHGIGQRLLPEIELAEADIALPLVVAAEAPSRPGLLDGWPQTPIEAVAPQDAPAIAAPVIDTDALDRALYQHARNGQIEAALQALSAGANAKAEPAADDRDQRSLPMLAALLGDLRLLRELIARGVELNAERAGLTPLLAATRDSWHGRPEAVMTLLANGADPAQADSEGNTPLHHAGRSTDPAVAALLLDAGAAIDMLNQDGVSPLGMACAAGNWRLAKFLIERGAKAEPAGGQPALLFAAGFEDDAAGVQLLLRHKGKVDSRGAQGRTALLQACQAGNADVAAALLVAGAAVNLADEAGMTPLLEAARSAQPDVLAQLLPAGPDPTACDARGRNALCLACIAGAPPALLESLLALGVDPQQADQDGRCAIDHALAAGRWPLVALLDPQHPLPASLVESGDAPIEKAPRALLREALAAGRHESAEALARLGAWPEPGELAQLLLEFTGPDDAASFLWLLRHGAQPDSRAAGADSVAFALLDRGGAAEIALQSLLDSGHGFNGRGGLSRFLAGWQAQPGSGDGQALAMSLLARGADPFGGDMAPLLGALRLGWTRLAETLLAAGAAPDVRDGRGHTALHLAVARHDEAQLRLLIRYGARTELAAPDGQTPLGLARAEGRRELAAWLDWRQWTPPGRPLQPGDLPAAASSGDVDAMRRLLRLGLPIDAVDAQGCSALLRAAGGGHPDAVASLLAAGANPTLAARTGATPLSAAISMQHGTIVHQLLQAGADPNQALPGAISPLMLAAALGLPDIVDRLLAAGADPQSVDEQGMSALHGAALHAFGSRDRQRALSLINTLLAAKVTPDASSAIGQTPLLLLLGARAEAGTTCDEEVLLAVLERLLGLGVDIDAQDHRGLSALHLAALHGLSRVVQRLLRAGAERNARDTLGRTPHDLAVLRGFVDVAAEFAPPRSASPSLARFLREPPGPSPR
ncbi:MAG TPA: ankyrin repeat domain-containing protein [Arenimonas sp.]|nr:ankyrin repeat domain-containing protein [Arenimonas sp.]